MFDRYLIQNLQPGVWRAAPVVATYFRHLPDDMSCIVRGSARAVHVAPLGGEA